MAIDTEDKRRSAVSTTPGLRILPVADGSITQPDWQHTAKVYRGITADNPVAVSVPLFYHHYQRGERH